ncbi:uncharacterized protein SPPG_00882 [Spizellomyces punctatus DAOM BR117]|uniref:Uncharacterized protein n=1 Tax=Spizellomyces punctatus (strain DAOM BR117) TaxID=645134 RepID=A0A0L0HR87_SPIPD|nr:uncharacterized protein SPPG_00882 [Spizellomyces punctatus DAOM BR117]KND03394.1 hypothetical protein SPPG_00882 [Spizellomyces punctatus DAOM BR117]|eukprot:XP_016611433.1 hypothetical protein SPPG_00882 [Spizellomyces punctatus DAOM BR117]
MASTNTPTRNRCKHGESEKTLSERGCRRGFPSPRIIADPPSSKEALCREHMSSLPPAETTIFHLPASHPFDSSHTQYMLLKSIKKFCKKLRKNGKAPVTAGSVRPDSVVIHEDAATASYRPSFLWESDDDVRHSIQDKTKAIPGQGTSRQEPRGSNRTSDMLKSSSQTGRSHDSVRPSYYATRPSIDSTRSATGPGFSFSTFTPTPIDARWTRRSADMPREVHHPFPPLPPSKLSPRPSSVTSSTHSSSVSAHLDAQMQALNGVFSRIRAAQDLKKENLQRRERSSFDFPRPGALTASVHGAGRGSQDTYGSLKTQTGRISQDTLSATPSRYDAPKRSFDQPRLQAPYLPPPTPKSRPIIVITPTPPDHDARSTVSHCTHKSNRTDSGFHRSELESLYIDLKDLSLDQLVEKYATVT